MVKVNEIKKRTDRKMVLKGIEIGNSQFWITVDWFNAIGPGGGRTGASSQVSQFKMKYSPISQNHPPGEDWV